MEIINPNLLCMRCMRERPEPSLPCPGCGFDEAQSPPAPHHLPFRSILNGRYLTGRTISEDGFSLTYLGWELNLNLKVVIKEYFPAGLVSRAAGSSGVAPLPGEKRELYAQGKEKFVKQARMLARFCSMPGVVGVRDVFEENGSAYLAMEYLEGTTLRQLLEQSKQSGVSMAAQALLSQVRPVMQTLGKMHMAGIVHRDIRPENLLLTADGQMKLLGFDYARSFSDGAQSELSTLLNPGCAPEEQYSAQGEQGPWTDVYALCATLYRALTGEVPDEPLDRMQSDSLKPPSQLGAQTTPAQDAAILKGLALEIPNRYQTVEALEQALFPPEPAPGQPDVTVSLPPELEPQPPQPPQPEPAEPERKSSKKKKILLISASAAAVVLIAAIALFAVFSHNGVKSSLDHGTTMGNLLNGGAVANSDYEHNKELDRKIYYIDYEQGIFSYPDEGGSFQGENAVKVNDAHAMYLQAHSNILFYLNLDDGLIHSIWSDSEESVGEDKVKYFVLHDNKPHDDTWIYYVPQSENGIWKMDFLGGNKEQISDAETLIFIIEDGWIYALQTPEEDSEIDISQLPENLNGGYLYKMRLDGSDRERVIDEPCSVFNIKDSELYYLTGELGILKKAPLNKTKEASVLEDHVTFFNFADRWIYYQRITDSEKGTKAFYRMETNGDNTEIIPELATAEMTIYSLGKDVFFFDTREDGMRMYRTTAEKDRDVGSQLLPNGVGSGGSSDEPSSSSQPPSSSQSPSSSEASSLPSDSSGSSSSSPEAGENVKIYGDKDFPYLENIVARVEADQGSVVDVGELCVAENDLEYTILGSQWIEDSDSATEDAVLVDMQVTLPADCTSSALDMTDFDFILLVTDPDTQDGMICLADGYQKSDSDAFYNFPMQVDWGKTDTVTLGFIVPKGYTDWTIMQTNLFNGNPAGPLYVTPGGSADS